MSFFNAGKFAENTQGVMIWQSKGLMRSEGTVENREHLFDLNWATWFKKHQNNTQNYICHPTLSRNTIPMVQSCANLAQSAIFSQPHMAVKIQWKVKLLPIFFNPWEMDTRGQSAFPHCWETEQQARVSMIASKLYNAKQPYRASHFLIYADFYWRLKIFRL